MDKTLRTVIIVCICVVTFSIFYYLVIHLPREKEIGRAETARKEQTIQVEKEINDDKLAEVKYWPVIPLPQVGAKCSMATSWREGRIYYVFEAAPLMDSKYPEGKYAGAWFSYSLLKRDIRLPIFTLSLMDKAGFEIMSIEMNDISRLVNNKNEPTMLQQKSSVECSKQKYQATVNWDVAWRK